MSRRMEPQGKIAYCQVMGPVEVLPKMPRVVPAKTEPEDGFMSGLHHDPPPHLRMNLALLYTPRLINE